MARKRRSSRKFSFGAPDGLQPGDDLGNRFKKGQGQLPPDDIGNRKSAEDTKPPPDDDIGNRIDINPTHSHSGVLAGLDKRKNRRKPKGSAPLVRIGRYFVGGVNPIVAGNTARAMKAHEEHEEARFEEKQESRRERDSEKGDKSERSRRRRRDDGGGDVSERRIRRFFDFSDDDRFDYALTTAPEDKRAAAEVAIQNVLTYSGREAKVVAHLIDDGTRPKVLVTIDEKGASAEVAAEKRSKDCAEPIYVLGNNALMSLNYIANKIVNRYPSDRIRLAIMPQSDESTYREELAKHQARRADEGQGEAGESEERAVKKESKKRDDKSAAPARKLKPGEREDEGDALGDAPKRVVQKASRPKPSSPRSEPFERVSLSAIASQVPMKPNQKAVKVVTKKAAVKKAATKKVAVKKAVTKKVAAKKKAATKKVVTKKVAKKTTTKKVATKKAATKKAVTKKATKKAATKKVVKKATTKKTAAKKTTKKAATKKAATKKTAKKSSTKKTSTKKAVTKKAKKS